MNKVFGVASSGTPLVFDTLPALKTTHFVHDGTLPSRDIASVYTYARLYILRGDLQLSLTAFERGPGAESRVAFAFGCDGGDRLAFAELSPDGAHLTLLPKRPAPGLWQPPCQGAPLASAPFAGVDEQGWYWGAQLSVPAHLLAGTGCTLAPGDIFGGALFKYRTDTTGVYGSSIAAGATPLEFDSFGRFEAESH